MEMDPEGCPWVHLCNCTSCIKEIASCNETCSQLGRPLNESFCTGDCCSACVCGACQSHDHDSCQSQCTQQGRQMNESYCTGDCCSACICGACQSHDHVSCQSNCTQQGKQVDQSFCTGHCCSECACILDEESSGGMLTIQNTRLFLGFKV